MPRSRAARRRWNVNYWKAIKADPERLAAKRAREREWRLLKKEGSMSTLVFHHPDVKRGPGRPVVAGRCSWTGCGAAAAYRCDHLYSGKLCSRRLCDEHAYLQPGADTHVCPAHRRSVLAQKSKRVAHF